MKLIILDRDGVINQESRAYIKSPNEWLAIPGSLEAIGRLTAAGYTICVATNQSGVGRRYFSEQALHDIHQHMLESITEHGGKIFKVYYCPHLPTDNCGCRKPAPGMFAQIAKDLGLDFTNNKFAASQRVIFVGDSKCDVELGLNTGCTFYLTAGFGSDGNDTLSKLSAQQIESITKCSDLAAVTDRILA